MTEYDYSPEAYERHMAKLNSVGRWAEQQAREAARYGNPFLPSEHQARPPTQYTLASSSTRSHSAPPTKQHGASSQRSHVTSHRTSHSHANSRSQSPASSTPYHSRSGSRAHSRPPPSRSHAYSPPNQMYSTSRPHSQPRQPIAAPTPHRSSAAPAHYMARPGQPVVFQGDSETYVVIPRSKTRVEVRPPQHYSSSPQPAYTSPHSYAHASHTSHKKQPLFKRILGFGSPLGSRKTHEYYPPESGTRRRTTSLY